MFSRRHHDHTPDPSEGSQGKTAYEPSGIPGLPPITSTEASASEGPWITPPQGNTALESFKKTALTSEESVPIAELSVKSHLSVAVPVEREGLTLWDNLAFTSATVLKALNCTILADWINRRLTRMYPHQHTVWQQAIDIASRRQNPLALQVASKNALRTLKKPSKSGKNSRLSAPKSVEVITLLKQLADASFACGDKDLALKCYHHVLKRVSFDDFKQAGPESANVLTTVGQLYSDRQQPMRALYYYREALRLASDKPYLHSRIGYSLVQLRDFEGAIESYQQAMTCSMGKKVDATWQATVCITLAQLYLRIYEQPTTALAWTQAAVSAQSRNPAILSQAVDLFNDLNYLPGTLAVYQALLPHLPQTAEHLNYLGYLYWQLDRNQDAKNAYQHAISADRDNWVAYNNLGIIYLDESDEPQKALGCFEKALAINGQYTMACFNLARAHDHLGNASDAARYYQHALVLNLEQPEVDPSEIQQRLSSLFEG